MCEIVITTDCWCLSPIGGVSNIGHSIVTKKSIIWDTLSKFLLQLRFLNLVKAAYKLLKAVISILREKYVGKKLTVKLKEIKAKAGVSHTINDDWEKMEFELRKVGWFVSYDGPGWDESYDAFYEIGAKNK